jgi:hypothetical protein
VFFDSLHLEFEFRQIGLQFFDLFSLGLEATLKMTSTSTAFTATITAASTLATTILTITSFILRHIISPYYYSEFYSIAQHMIVQGFFFIFLQWYQFAYIPLSQLSLKRPIQHGRQQRPPKERAQLLPRSGL